MRYPKFKLRNYTGHVVHDAMGFMTYPAETMNVARCNYTMVPTGQTEDGSIIYTANWESISGLPEPEEGVKYLVSSKVLNAALSLGREDCISVNDVIRNRDGKAIGCKGFRTNG